MVNVNVAERLADAPAVRDTILNAARDPHMAQSWVITGPPGSGRSVAAMAFAAALECTNDGEVGCGHCEGCRATFQGSHTDVIHIVPQELSISVDDVREVRREAQTLPTVGRRRVIIIEDADRLTIPAANALLKTVEEPPEHTVILMCAPSLDPRDFVPTLRSRSRHLYVPYPSVEAVVATLMADGDVSEADARLAAAATMRHIGRAKNLVRDADNQSRRASALSLAEMVFHKDEAFKLAHELSRTIKAHVKKETDAALAEATERLEVAMGKGARGKGVARMMNDSDAEAKRLKKQFESQKTRRERDFIDLALTDLAALYRDALVTAYGANVELTHPDFAGLSGDLATRVGEEGLVECLEAISWCRELISRNVTIATALDGMVGKLRLACGVD